MREVITQANGETAAHTGSFEDFFEAKYARLFATLCLVTGDRAEAEDVMQETFLKIWERWDRIQRHPDPDGYLYRTAFNVFRSRVRGFNRAARRLAAPSPRQDPLAEVELREDLAAGLRALTPRQRAAVVLLDLLDLTSEEAGKALGVRPVTVRVLASQGHAALRDMGWRTDE